MAATIGEVAKLAGVAVSTVSYAFSDKRTISNAVREKVFEAAATLGYKPKSGWSRDEKSARLIGLFGCNIASIGNNIHVHQILMGIFENLNNTDYHALFIPDYSRSVSEKNIARLTKLNLFGAIVIEPKENEDYAAFFRELKIPFVLIGRPDKAYEADINYVDIDNISLGYKSCEYLLERKFTDILFINGPDTLTVSEDRKKGVLLACEKYATDDLHIELINTEFSITEAHDAVLQLYSEKKPFSAIIASSDLQAIGALRAIVECGYECPNDVSIICTGETYLTTNAIPHITGMDNTGSVIGGRAVNLLIRLISKELIRPSHIVMHSTLHERDSVMTVN